MDGGTPLPTPAERKTVIGRAHAWGLADRNKGFINLDVQHICDVVYNVLCTIVCIGDSIVGGLSWY